MKRSSNPTNSCRFHKLLTWNASLPTLKGSNQRYYTFSGRSITAYCNSQNGYRVFIIVHFTVRCHAILEHRHLHSGNHTIRIISSSTAVNITEDMDSNDSSWLCTKKCNRLIVLSNAFAISHGISPYRLLIRCCWMIGQLIDLISAMPAQKFCWFTIIIHTEWFSAPGS